MVQVESTGKLGSGIVFDGNGDIVTNAHVVSGSRTFTITTSDGKRHSATLRGAFTASDLAVVRVSGDHLTAAHFADSSRLKVGERVLAIGNPLGLRSSVTDGIVSAVARTVSEGNGVALPSVVRTSAAINPGNSGGALIDLTGVVIGIPTLAATDPELGGSAAPGVGFAISSDTVTRIAGQLAKEGQVVDSGRASLGIDLRSLPNGGVMVASVTTGGPSARAGVYAGDLIAAIAGRPVGSLDGVSLALATRKPGDTVRVRLRQPDGSTAAVSVELGQLPGLGAADPAAVARDKAAKAPPADQYLVELIAPPLARYRGGAKGRRAVDGGIVEWDGAGAGNLLASSIVRIAPATGH